MKNTMTNQLKHPESIVKEETGCAGNAAKMREALLMARNALVLYSRDMKPRYQVEVGFTVADCDDALSKLPRNCDKYGKRDCVDAFIRKCACGKIDIETATAGQVDEFMRNNWFAFKLWLFATAEEEGGAE